MPNVSERASALSAERRTYLPTLDGWRAVAILIVMFGHLCVGIGLGGFREIGGLGVQLFFGLSGFLITTLLLDEERKTGSISLRGFYRRRAFRILPAAFVFLVAVGLVALSGAIPLTLSRWLSTLLFAANYTSAPSSWYVGHFWSLAVEEHFYLLWPATLCLVRTNRNRLQATLAVALLIGLWRAIDFTQQLTWSERVYFVGRTDINADGLLFGCIFALALADQRLGPRIRRIVEHRLAAGVAICLFALTFVIETNPALGFALLTVRAATVPVMILATMNQPQGWPGRVLEARPMRFVGVISYSLYLWQQLFLTWEPASDLSAVQWFPLNLVAAFVCAWLSFVVVERPMIRFGRRGRLRTAPLKSLPA